MGTLNASALAEYKKQLNTYANTRDALIGYITNLLITNIESIKLQASSLAQLTQATNQLTRNTLVKHERNLLNVLFSIKLDVCIG